MIHRCSKHGRTICIWCALQSLMFPVEHALWTRAPGLRHVAHLFGL